MFHNFFISQASQCNCGCKKKVHYSQQTLHIKASTGLGKDCCKAKDFMQSVVLPTVDNILQVGIKNA